MDLSRTAQIAALAAAATINGEAQKPANTIHDIDSAEGQRIVQEGQKIKIPAKPTNAIEKQFLAAVREGNVKAVEKYINSKPAPDLEVETVDRNTALAIAIGKNDTKMALALIKGGADVNIDITFLAGEDVNALQTAIMMGNTDIAGAMLKYGAKLSEETAELLDKVARKETDPKDIRKMINELSGQESTFSEDTVKQVFADIKRYGSMVAQQKPVLTLPDSIPGIPNEQVKQMQERLASIKLPESSGKPNSPSSPSKSGIERG